MQQHMMGADACLLVLDESIIGRQVGGAIAHCGQSLIATIVLFVSC